jgi:hypothetical protein
MAGAFQTVELKIPVSPEVNAARLNASVGVFKGMAQKVAGLFGAQKFAPTLDASKLNASAKAAQTELRATEGQVR